MIENKSTDINASGQQGETALMRGTFNMLNRLIKRFFYVYYLFQAANLSNIEFVQALISSGKLKIDLQDVKGETALFIGILDFLNMKLP